LFAMESCLFPEFGELPDVFEDLLSGLLLFSSLATELMELMASMSGDVGEKSQAELLGDVDDGV